MNKPSGKNYVKIGEASKILNVSIDTLRRWEKSGKITVQRSTGGTRLYPLNVKIGDASKILGVSIDTLRRWEKSGKIQTLKTSGGTRLYPLETLKKIVPVKSDLTPSSTQPNYNINPSQNISMPTTEELLKKVEQKSEVRDEKLDLDVLTSRNQDIKNSESKTSHFPHQDIKQPSSIFTKLIWSSALISSAVLTIVGLITISYLTDSENTQRFFKYSPLSGIFKPFQNISREIAQSFTSTPLDTPSLIAKSSDSSGSLSDVSSSEVLAVTASSQYLEINSDTQIQGSLSVKDSINNIILEATESGTLTLSSGDTTLTVTSNALLNQDLSTTSSPTFSSLTSSTSLSSQTISLSSTSNQITNGSNQFSLPSTSDTLVGRDTTDTLTNKTISGLNNTLKDIPNSAITNAKITVNAGTNLTGGGEVALGSSITVSLKDSIDLGGTLDVDGATTLGSTLAVTGATTLSSTLAVTGTSTLTGAATLSSTLNVTGATTLSSTLGVTGAATFSSTINSNTFTSTALTFAGNSPIISSANSQFGISGGLSLGTNYIGTAPPPEGLIVQGNVGLGTSAPQGALDVNGTTFLRGYGGGAGLVVTSTGNVGIGISDPVHKFQINAPYSTSTSKPFVVTSTGNVGIGTSTPQAELHLYASASNTGSGNDEMAIFLETGANNAGESGLVFRKSRSDGIISSQDRLGEIEFYGHDGDSFSRGARIFVTAEGTISDGIVPGRVGISTTNSAGANTTRFVIGSEGNVGIGSTVSPASLLDVNSSTGGVITASRTDTSITANDSLGKLQFYGIDSQLSTQRVFADIEAFSTSTVSTDTAAGYLVFRTTPSTVASQPIERMRIDASGNVGIGTTAMANATFSLGGNQIIGTNYVQNQIAPTNGLLVEGNVGIGATFTSTYTLSVGGNIGVSGHVLPLGASRDIGSSGLRWNVGYFNEINATTIAGVISGGSTTSSDWTINSDNATADTETASLTFERGSETPNAVLRWETGSKLFNLNSGLLIGSTSMDSQITDNPYGLVFSNTPFDITSGTNEHISIVPNGTGNVGIGTTAPSAKLTVAGGSILLDNDQYLNGKDTGGTARNLIGMSSADAIVVGGGSSTNVYIAGGGGRTTIGISSGAGSELGVAGNVGIGSNFYAAAIPTNGLAVEGNIGIGTTSPLGALQVHGNGSNTAFFLDGNVGIGTTNPRRLLNLSANGATAQILFENTAGVENNKLARFGRVGTNAFGIQFLNDANSAVLGTYGQAFIIDSTNGNVGLGTATPLAKLSVTGNVGIGTSFGSKAVPAHGLAVEGNVGIGTTTANNKLAIVGSVNISNNYQNISAPTSGLFVEGNVGIGATTSDNKLDIWGNTRITGNLTVDGSQTFSGSPTFSGQILASDGTAAAPGYSFLNDQDTGIFRPSTNALGFSTNGSSKLTITEAGNIGIGTTAPDTALNLASGVLRAGTVDLGAKALEIFSNGSSTNGVLASFQDNNLSNGHSIITSTIGNSLTGSGYFFKGSGSTTGNAYITTQQNGTGNAVLEALVLGSGDAQTNFTVNGGQSWSIGLDNSDSDSFKISSATTLGAADRLIIKTDGNVGIGNSAPDVLLDVISGSTLDTIIGAENTNGLGFSRLFAERSTNAAGVEFRASTSGAGYGARIRDLAISGRQILNFDYRDNSSSWTTAMTVNNGNLGIGTTGPSSRLHVIAPSAGSSTPLNVQNYSFGNSLFAVISDASEHGQARIYNNAGSPFIALRSSGDSWFHGGNIGVGTSTPINLLNLEGSNPAISLTQTGQTNWTLGVRSDNTQNLILGYSATIGNSPIMSFQKTTGNVGIATTSPIALLHIGNNDDTPTISPELYLASAGQTDLVVRDTADNVEVRLTPYNGGVAFGTVSSHNLEFRIANTTEAVLNTSGNFGIGTGTSPAADFHLVGDAASTAVQFLTQNSTRTNFGLTILDNGNVGIGLSNPAAPLEVKYSQDGITSAGLIIWNDSLNGAATTSVAGVNFYIGDGTTPNVRREAGFIRAGESGIYEDSNSVDSYLSFGTALNSDNIERLRIDSNGNVGIGTTNPTNRLQVSGGNTYLHYDGTAVSTGTVSGLQISNSGTANNSFIFRTLSNSGATPSFAITNTGNVGIGTTDLTALFQVGGYAASTSPALQISQGGFTSSAGNIGIGTSGAAQARLEIAAVANTGNANNGLRISSGYNSVVGDAGYRLTDLRLKSDAAGTYRFSLDVGNGGTSTGTEIISIPLQTGNIGIGWTSPIAKLHLLNTSTTTDSFRVDDIANDLSSFIIDQNGNVGIGVSGPVGSSTVGYNLDVWGSARFTGNVTFEGASTSIDGFLAPDGTASSPAYSFSLDQDTGIFRPGTNALGFTTGSSSRMTITAAGLVGIGTTAPTGALHVNYSNSSGDNNGLRVTGNYASISGANAVDFNIVGAHGGGVLALKNTRGPFGCSGCVLYGQTISLDPNIMLGGNGKSIGLFIDPGENDNTYGLLVARGNVGIGVTNPSAKLSVTGNVGIGISFGTGVIPTNGLAVQGNVGIGTTTTGAKLDVSGDVRIGAGSANSVLSFLDANSSNYYRTITSTGAVLEIKDSEPGGAINIVTPSDSTFAFELAAADGESAIDWDDTSNILALMRSGGNVGIGTSAPSSKLHLASDTGSLPSIDSDTDLIISETSAAGDQAGLSIIGGASGFSYIWLGDTSSEGVGRIQYDHTNDLLDLYAGGTRTATLKGGNLGVGATNPTAKLHVVASSGATNGIAIRNDTQGSGFDLNPHNSSTQPNTNVPWLRVGGGSSDWLMINPGSDTGAVSLAADNAGEVILAAGGGNVGVGTNSPLFPLHVTSGTTGTSIASYFATGAGGQLAMLGNGNVGIGKTNPGNRLHVYSTTNADGLSIDGTTSPAINFRNSGTIRGYIGLATTNGAYFTNTLANDLVIRSESNNIHFGQSTGASTMTINAGNVGIGFTSPTANLHVVNTASQNSFRVDDAANDTTPFKIDDAGNVGISTNATLDASLYINSSTDYFLRMSRSGVGNFDINVDSGRRFSIGDYATRYLTIDTNGNVGINTALSTNAVAKLQLIGAGTSTGRTFMTQNSDKTNFGLAVLDNGNVGIGTTLPTSKLDVQGTAGSTFFTVKDSAATAFSIDGFGGLNQNSRSIFSPSTYWHTVSNPIIRVDSLSSQTGDIFQVNTSSSDLTGSIFQIDASGNVGIGVTGGTVGALFQVGLTSSPGLAVTSGQRVGIGTTNPVGKLHVVAGGTSSLTINNAQTGLVLTTNSNGGNRLYMENTSSTSGQRVFMLDNNGGVLSFNSTNDGGTSFVSQNILNVRYDGNVGIGWTNPAAKLDIVNNNTVSFNSDIYGTSATGTRMRWAGGTQAAFTGLSAGNDLSMFELFTGGGTNPAFFSTPTIRMGARVKAVGSSLTTVDWTFFQNATATGSLFPALTIQGDSGNIGLGTTTPNSDLVVVGKANIGSSYAGATSPTSGLLVEGNVGIGTTGLGSSGNGSFNLDVWGTARITGALTVNGSLNAATGSSSAPRFLAQDGSASAPSFSFTNETDLGLWRPNTNVVALTTSSTPTTGGSISGIAVHAGNLGIGTSTAGAQLHIRAATPGIMFTTTTGGAHSQQVIRSSASDASGQRLIINSGGPTIIGGGESADTIDTNIAVSDETLILAGDNTSTNRAIQFLTSLQSGWNGQVHAMTILGNGNVGIGITLPTANLEIKGTPGNVGTLIVGGGNTNITAVNQEFSALEFKSADTSISSTNNIAGRIASISEASNGANSGLGFFTFTQTGTALTEKLRITNTGNIGIGTSTPLGALDVTTGNILFRKIGAVSYSGFSNSGVLYYDSQGGDLTLNAYSTGGNTAQHFLTSSAGVNTEKLTILSGGNVGIGFTTPIAKLEVSQGDILLSNNQAIKWRNLAGTPVTGIYLDTSNNLVATSPSRNLSLFDGSNSHFLDVYTSNTIGARIHSSGVSYLNGGNVGINITTPAAKLHLLGTASSTAPALIVQNSTRTNFGLAVLDNGNVGIGTTRPNTLLQIYNSSTTNSGVTPNENLRLQGRYNGVATVGSGAFLRFTNFHASGDNPSTSEYNLAGIGAYDYDSNWGGALVFYTSPGADVGGAGLAQRMLITPSGNVGIGTTLPTSALNVEGRSTELPFYVHNNTAGNFNATFLNDFVGGARIGGGHTGIPFQVINGSSTPLVSVNSSGNLGIGTSNPNQKLHLRLTGDDYQRIEQTAANNFGIIFQRNDGTANASSWYLYQPAGNKDFRFYDGSDRVTFQSGGNVGIGFTSPTSLLDIRGGGSAANVNIQSTSNSTSLTLDRGSSSQNGEYLLKTSGTTYAAFGLDSGANSATLRTVNNTGLTVSAHNANLTLTGGSSAGIILNTNGSTEVMRLTSGGNVGINTISPSAKLQVNSSTSSQAPNFFTTNGTTFGLFAQDDGNVGIGVTNSNKLLAITPSSTSYYSSTFSGLSSLVGIGGNQPDLTWSKLTFGNGQGQGNYAGIGVLRNDAAGTTLVLGTSNSFAAGITNMAFAINPSGNVGIGTTSPGYKLVVGTGETSVFNASQLLLNVAQSGGTIMSVRDTSNNMEIGMGTDLSSGAYGWLGTGTNHPLRLFTNNSTQMTIDTAGNVGIGFTSPAGLLHVGTNNPSLYVASGTGNVGVGTLNPQSFFTVSKDQNSDTSAIVSNLSTGAASASRLQVTSSNSVSAYLRTQSSGYTTSLQYIANGSLLESNGSGGLAISSGGGSGTSEGPIMFWMRGAEKMRIDTAGNVGIGTTGPFAKLHVNGNTGIESGSSIGTLLGSSTYKASIQFGDQAVDNEWLILRQSPTARGIYISSSGTGTPTTYVAESRFGVDMGAAFNAGVSIGSTYESIARASLPSNGLLVEGNVGIGFTSPTAKLTVSGNTQISNQLGSLTSLTDYGLNMFHIPSGGGAGSGTFAGIYNVVQNQNGAATQYGIYGEAKAAGAPTITNLYSGYFAGPSGGLPSAITNSYSLYLTAPSTGVTQYTLYSASGNNYFGGNVGIGTSAPISTARVHVLGSGTSTGKTFMTQNSTRTNFGLAVLDNGNVGIGTTLPANKLEIGGSGSSVAFTGGGTNVILTTTSLAFRIDSDNNSSSEAFAFQNNTGTELMRLTEAGNIGLGFTTPDRKTQIAADIANSSVTVGALLGTNGSQLSLTGSSATTLNEKLVLGIDTTSNIGFIQAGNNAAGIGNSTPYSLVLNPGGGNIGIGTSLPTALLDINGNTSTDDYIKTTTADFSNVGVGTTNIVTSNGQISQDLGTAGMSVTAGPSLPAGTPTIGSHAFQRPDGKFVSFNANGAVTTNVYDPATNSFSAGPSATTAIGNGAHTFQRPDGKYLIITGGNKTNTNIYDPNTNAFSAGPALTAASDYGSQTFPRPDGKFITIIGNGTTTTNIYDPALNTFSAGPAMTTLAGQYGTKNIQMPNGKVMILMGRSTTATNIYDPVTNSFSAGPATTQNISLGGAFERPDGKFIITTSGTTTTVLYDPVVNTFSNGPVLSTALGGAGSYMQRPDGSFIIHTEAAAGATMIYNPVTNTFSAGTSLTTQGGFGHHFQRQDGTYVMVAGNNAVTNLIDAGWRTSGGWHSEPIRISKLSSNSTLSWKSSDQNSTNPSRIDQKNVTVEVRTATTQAGLSSATYYRVANPGDNIPITSGATWVQVKVTFNVPIPAEYLSQTNSIREASSWSGGWGGSNVYYQRDFAKPALYELSIQNPIAFRGGGSNIGIGSTASVWAQQGASFNMVDTTNDNLIKLTYHKNQGADTTNRGIQVSDAATPTNAPGTGAHTFKRPDGKYLMIAAGSTVNTNIYDPNTNSFTAGPNLTTAAANGSYSIQRPDGKFMVILGGLSITNLYDPATNSFYVGPTLTASSGDGGHAIQRPDGKFIIIHGAATTTDLYDPTTNAIYAGPALTATANAGALTIKTYNNRFLTVLGNNATTTNVYDYAINSFFAGPAAATSHGAGTIAFQRPDGRFIILSGNTTATTDIYDPVANSFSAGPALTSTSHDGSLAMQMPDGKYFVPVGNGLTITNIYDPLINSFVAGPAVSTGLDDGSHVFQLPDGKFFMTQMNCCGTRTYKIYDLGWSFSGTYTSEQINNSNLSANTVLNWQEGGPMDPVTGQTVTGVSGNTRGKIYAKVRSASSQMNLGSATWKDVVNGQNITSGTDTWVQVRFDLQGVPVFPHGNKNVWTEEKGGGFVHYYIQPVSPTLVSYSLTNRNSGSVLNIANNGSTIFRFTAEGSAYTSDQGAWYSGGADIAEYYTSTESLEAGDLVIIDKSTQKQGDTAHDVVRSTQAYQNGIVGAVSTKPGFVAGAYTEGGYPIALSGRVPVKISLENGKVQAGDYLTSSSIPGYAMKSTKPGYVLGQALENYDGNEEDNKIMAFINPGYADPANFLSSLTLDDEGNLIAPKVKSEKILISDGLKLDSEDLTNSLLVYEFGQTNLSSNINNGTDYKTKSVDVLASLKSLDQALVDLKTKQASDSADIAGVKTEIASTSAQLASASAEIAETKAQTKSLSEQILELSAKIASQSAVKSTEQQLSEMNLMAPDTLLATGSATIANLNVVSEATVSGMLASYDLKVSNSLKSLGTTTLGQTTIAGNLSVDGTLTIEEGNQLNVVGTLYLQKSMFAKSIDIFDGRVTIDNLGNITSQGTISSSEIRTNRLTISNSPVATGSATLGASIGTGTLSAGQTKITIPTTGVTSTDKIFITPTSSTDKVLSAINIKDNQGFDVSVLTPSATDIKFNWWIIKTE